MTPELARAILKEVQSGGFMSGDLPEDEELLVSLAQEWAEEALRSHNKGDKHSTVTAIVELVNTQLQQGNTAVADNEREEPDPALAAVEDTYPRRSSGGVSESDEREADRYLDSTHPLERFIAQNNLPLPKEVQNDPTPMPSDISEVGDKQVRKLSIEYNAYLGRVKWLLAIATSDLANSTHLRDEAYRKSLKRIDRIDPDTEKAKLASVIDAEVKDNADYRKWDSAVRAHQDQVTAYKALEQIYAGNIDRLSREWTMRQDEWNKSR